MQTIEENAGFEGVTRSFSPAHQMEERRRQGRRKLNTQRKSQAQLSSLLGYLDEVDARTVGSIAVDSASDYMQANSAYDSPPRSGLSTEGRRRFVWDQWGDAPDEGQEPGLGSPDSSISSASRAFTTASQRSASTIATSFREVQGKVSVMMEELEGKNREVEALREELRNTRDAGRRSREKVEVEWGQRFDQMRAEQESTLDSQRKFTSQLVDDVQGLKDKWEAMESQLHRAERHRVAEMEAAKRDNINSLKRHREQWVQNEKERLTRLAAQRSADLKDAAVRSLEPSLHDMISKQRQRLRDREADLADGQRKMLMVLRRKHAMELEQRGRDSEKENGERLLSQRQAWTNSLREIMATHERDMRDARAAAHRTMDEERREHDEAWRRARDELEGEADQVRQHAASRAKTVADDHEKRVSARVEEQEAILQRKKAGLAVDTEKFQRKVLKELHGERQHHREAAVTALRSKMEDEVTMVREKLAEDAREEGERLQLELDRRLHDLSARWEETERLLSRDVTGLSEAAKSENDRATRLHRTVGNLGERDRELKNLAAGVRTELREMRGRKDALQLEWKTSALQLEEGHTLAQRGHAAKLLEQTRRRDIAEQSLSQLLVARRLSQQQLEDELCREMEDVKGRVAGVRNRKETAAQRLAEELSRLQDENDGAAERVEQLRRQLVEGDGRREPGDGRVWGARGP